MSTSRKIPPLLLALIVLFAVLFFGLSVYFFNPFRSGQTNGTRPKTQPTQGLAVVTITHPQSSEAKMFNRIDICEGWEGLTEVYLPNGTKCTRLPGGAVVSPCGSDYGTYYHLTCGSNTGYVNEKFVR